MTAGMTPVQIQAQARLRRRRAQQREGVGAFADWLPQTTPRFAWGWAHLQTLRQQLDRVTSGDIRRLMIFLPPRHGKSELTTIHYPAYRLECNPTQRIIVGAYNATLAEKFSRRTRAIVRNRGVLLDTERLAVNDWLTTGGGGLRAIGVGGGITGQGGDLIIIDDPVKSREEAESLAYRDRVWDWYTNDLYTRQEPGASIVLIMTRWHVDDLAGRILSSERAGDWHVLELPALAESNDPLGRAVGTPLCPERYDAAALEDIRSTLGTRDFTALYQQHPQPLEGALFKRPWFRIVDRVPDGLFWARYWDLAASVKTSADYTCSAAVAYGEDGTLYIRDMVRGRWEWPDARKIITQTMLSEPGVLHAVEEAMHGLAAIQEFRRDPELRGVALRGIKVDKDKLTRALPWAARAEGGKVSLVRGAWINAFLDEVCMFDGLGTTHDDQVDTVSGGAELVKRGSNSAVGAFG